MNLQQVSAIPIVYLDPVLRSAPLKEVIAGAREGTIAHLVELQQRAADFYSLEAFLCHLRTTATVTGLDQYSRWRAYLCIHALIELTVGCQRRPSTTSRTVQRLIDALPGIVSWVYPVLGIERDKWSEAVRYELSDPIAHGKVAMALLRVCNINKATVHAVTGNALVADLCVMWWAATMKGQPMLYAASIRSNSGDDGAVDPAIQLLELIERLDPNRLAERIESGKICSSKLFFEHASQRMQLLAQPHTIPHLSHLPEVSVETLNLNAIVGMVDGLIIQDRSLDVTLLESGAPKLFMDALVRSAKRSSLLPLHYNRRKYLADHLNLAEVVVTWANLRASYAIRVTKDLITAGVLELLGLCAPFLDVNESSALKSRKNWDHILQMLMWCSTTPRIISLMRQGLLQHITPLVPEQGIPSYWRHLALHSVQALGFLARYSNKAHRHKLKKAQGSVIDDSAQRKEDWDAYHRLQCRGMRSEYLERRYSHNPYSHNTRSFQTTALRRAYQPMAIESEKATSSRTKLVMTLDVIDISQAVTYDTVPDYLTRVSPLVPSHLRKKFNDIVDAFVKNDHKFGLVNGVFRYGDTDVNIVVLFFPSHVVLYPGEPYSNVDVQASIVFTSPHRNRYEAYGGSGGHEMRNSALWYHT
ncbi:hypothetical protein NMY22_g7713 [Coprinellus aureogranulatus]|nr:hypothetical protein NMY22_g7713 [Coprinellus aureogranulatus]